MKKIHNKIENIHHKIILMTLVVLILLVLFFKPDFIKRMIFEPDFGYVLTILLYLPGFFILMGLIEVWLPQRFIISHLGKHSGIKGGIFSFLMGSLLPGPIYLAFPIAGMLLKKGISRFNIALFIGAWSSFKLGEEIFEFQFLGIRFLILRIILTIPFILLISFILHKVHFNEKLHH
ncbi:MAG: permease [Candidatus Woesearchaeota archaeon]